MTNTETLSNGTTVTIHTADAADLVRRESRFAVLGRVQIEVNIYATSGKGFRVAWAADRGQGWCSKRRNVSTDTAARALADRKWAALIAMVAVA